jgi:HSP20 family protein
MSSKHRDPLQELEAMLRGWSPPATASPRGGHETMTTADWTPAVDIAETADEYLINVELTEVSKADVKISARDGVLAIEGQRRVEQPAGLTYHRLERGHGTFARRFTLPEDVEAERIRAEHREGMLYLHLPKHKELPRKAIHIKVE